MELKSLNKKVLTLWYIHALLYMLPTVAVWLSVFLPLTLSGVDPKITLAVMIPLSIVAALILMLIFALPYFRYKLYLWGYDERTIEVRLGVIFRKRIVIPVYQIQDLHRFEGPIMMALGISGVTISTAGSNFDLATLTRDEADKMIGELEEYLERRIKEKKDEEI
jgi:membrane protein YdbS with pleckstrin-like domain